MPCSLVSQLASEYVKVVLSGEGADELFGGYTVYNEPRVFRLYHKLLPQSVRTGLRKLVQKVPRHFRGQSFITRGEYPTDITFIGNAKMFSCEEKQKLLKHPEIATPPQTLTRPWYDRVKHLDDVTRMQYLDINMWMVGDILLKADRMSMANSLELRVPFLDKEVFKVASTIPTRLRVNRKNTKYAMRQAALRHLPPATAQKKKLGFPRSHPCLAERQEVLRHCQGRFHQRHCREVLQHRGAAPAAGRSFQRPAGTIAAASGRCSSSLCGMTFI